MKVVILAGGLGTRLAEETVARPKPMVEIGGRPILWHLLHLYSAAGFTEFIIACGYRQEVIKEYFRSLYSVTNDLTVDFSTGEIEVTEREKLNWKVHVVDTGLNTMTGGRIKRLASLVGNETFLCTYGDGLASVDPGKVLEYHRSQGKQATVTGVRPPARFGVLGLEGDYVRSFEEKPQTSAGWINGGFFVFEPGIFNRIDGDQTLLEHEPLAALASEGELVVYRHEGFWHPMDTLRDKRYLEELWSTGAAPWVSRP